MLPISGPISTPAYPKELTTGFWADIKIPKDYAVEKHHGAIKNALTTLERQHIDLKLSPLTDILDTDCNGFRECVDGCNNHLSPAMEQIKRFLNTLKALQKSILSVAVKRFPKIKYSAPEKAYSSRIEEIEEAAQQYLASLKTFVKDLVAWRKSFRPQDKVRLGADYRITWRDPKSATR